MKNQQVEKNQDFYQQKYRALLKFAPDGIHILDMQGNVVECSDSFAKNLGYTPNEIKQRNMTDWDVFIPPEKLIQTLHHLIKTPKTFESKHKRKDGTIIDVEVRTEGIEFEGEHYLYASQHDITEANRKKEKLIDLNHELEKSISALERASDHLEDEKNKYQTLLNLSSDGVFIMDLEGRLIEYSNKAQSLLGYSDEEMKHLSVYDWDKEITKGGYQLILDALESQPIETERIHTRKDGTIYVAHITASLLTIYERTYVYASVRDLTKYKALIKKLEDSEFRWKFAIEGNKDGLWDWSLETNEVFFSSQWKKMLGFREDEIPNLLKEWEKRVYPEDLEQVYKKIRDFFEAKTDTYENEYRLVKKDGSYIWVRDRGAIVDRNNKGKPLRLIGTLTDITKIHAMNEVLKKQLLTDELTQLRNRKAYNQRIEELVSEYKRYKNIFSFIMFDIDHFKSINDTYGHHIGDKVLRDLSDKIQTIIRTNDYFYRVGGEEFVILLSNTPLENGAILAEKVRKTVQDEVNIIHQRDVTVSIGLTQVKDNDTEDSIYNRADQFLYDAKKHGRNRISYA
jgi:diguanylate cyclase (GGDEF)-like protein/PAS domain S-box-containing protein